MRYATVLFVTIATPLTVNAQFTETSLPVPASRIIHPPDTEQVLNGSINTRIHQLAARTIRYKSLKDTVAIEKVKHLQAGALVVVRATDASWLRVSRAKSPTQFRSDTTSFYIPKTALKGAKTFIPL